MDEVHNTAHPSAAFLMASQGLQGSADDSFGSSNRSSDSLSEEDVAGLPPIHPFARGITQDGGEGFDDDDDDDTFDDDMYEDGRPQEETLFGVPPAKRAQAQLAETRGEQFRMLGEGLLQDTLGIGEQMARTGRVEESPTPAGPFHD
jgi:DASH complex subunit ASK1